LKQVKSLSDLSVIADVFAKTEQFDSAKDTYLKIYNKSKTRRILHRLIYISIRTKDIDEAEDYYQEFIQMNPSPRDIITTRYRIDKAAGVPIGRLIEILEELKEEEYIEEWAYELAKLYHKAGRLEECRRECEDIKLWFGHGEIVERAKKLINCIDDKEALPYIDDKDYTLDKGEPNPDDTGSLPNLDEYLQRKSQKDEKQTYTAALEEKRQEPDMEWIEDKEQESRQTKTLNNDRNDENMHEQDDFIDDYDEDDFDIDAGLGKLARKLTGLFRFGNKKNNNNNYTNKSRDIQDNKRNSNSDNSKEENDKDRRSISNSGSDGLDIKISINNELYNKTLENKNIQNKDDIEEIQEKESLNEACTSENNTDIIQQNPVVPVYSQSGMGITQDLSREISAIYEAEHGGQAKERTVKTPGGRRPLKRDATKVIERMTKAVKSDESKSIQPAGTDDADIDISSPKHQKDLEAEAKEAEEARLKQEAEAKESEEARLRQEAEAKESEEAKLRQEAEAKEAEEARLRQEAEAKEAEEARLRQEAEADEIVMEEQTNKAEEAARLIEKEAQAIVEEARRKAEEAQRILEEAERKRAEVQAALLSNNKEKAKTDNIKIDETDEEPEESIPEDIDRDSGWYEDENCDDEFYDDAEYGDDEDILDFDSKGLSDADLPTTRALHTSFDDILTLIGGEQDPSHFVFVGNNSNLIVGLSKRIVKVMKETGYMSTGRIAKISAKKLNQMDLSGFKSQLKGNCLLIHEAAELMVPTIASVFEIMDEFYGDFVVILADDGNTLDQLFKFTPTLAKRFKYIIDISGYTEADCE
ncbi:MAG TPA: hypothetical protein DCZ23_03795, partial [Lachnospiraceae bacterium]|nr:hypothetical protein [Lachnospiraceae bacterium]